MKKIETEAQIESHRKLSLTRVGMSALLVSSVVYGVTFGMDHIEQKKSQPVHEPWFASYVDVTATPTHAFEQLGSTSTPNTVLSFIVAAAEDSCTPTWGTYYTMDEAATALDVDRRIARLQQQGGAIAVSFGGAINSELAYACKNADELYNAYKSVIDRYGIDTIDLDIEGENLKDVESISRRADVIARLQRDYRSEDKSLAVWLTLPVSPHGLTEDGTTIVSHMITGGVDIAGVNVMTMDYGASREERSMLEASQQALIETHRQLGVLYTQAGITLSNDTLWHKIGATPMIGQNDVMDEVFTVEDAKNFNIFMHEQGVGRVSMWSVNRDAPCGENYVDVKVVSDSCSGVDASKFSFMQTLGEGFTGNLAQSAKIVTVGDLENVAQKIDNPENSPYQIWKETGAYPKGTKVVWHGYVYEAKWWTKKDLPDNPVLQAWETPWQLVGPVLEGEKFVEQKTLPEGTYPKWNGEKIYRGGEHILFDGTAFYAKWWTQGDSPAAAAANPDSSPWVALTQAQILDALNDLSSDDENSESEDSDDVETL